MPTTPCPACGLANPSTYAKCRGCDTPLASAAPALSTEGVWRDERVLVFNKAATLPERCVRCNEPSEGSGYKSTFYWHEPALYLLILCGLLVYFIVALIVRKKAEVFVGLCPRHAAQRQRGRIGGGLLLVLGLVFLPVAAVVESGGAFFGWTGLVMIVVAIVLSAVGSVGIRPQRIDDQVVRLKGVNRDYLARLPSWSMLAS
jgi:hypothetical protein